MRCAADNAAECLSDHILPHIRGAVLARDKQSLRGLAPCHLDTDPSLSISVRRGRIVWNCFACVKRLGSVDQAQRLTRNALIKDCRVPERCLPLAAREAVAELEDVRAIATGKGTYAQRVLRIIALLEGYDGLPNGQELETLAEAVGMSRSKAFEARSAFTLNPVHRP
jgi:hypothetical protein